MKIYISGQITGLKEAVARQRFEHAEISLSKAGFSVINPMKLNHNHDKEWHDYMREDIVELMKCDGVFLLKGWINSRGARLEYIIAKELGLQILGSEKEYKLNVNIGFDLDEFFRLPFIQELKQTNRRLEILIKRQYIMWWLHSEIGITLSDIASRFNMHHSTIINACKRIEEIFETKWEQGLVLIETAKKQLFVHGYGYQLEN